MKFLKHADGCYVFRMGRKERELLTQVLARYPCIPQGHFKLRKPGEPTPPEDEHQKLLDEALEDQRLQSRRMVAELINSPTRFETQKVGVLFRLTEGELEWLLKVLNDIRVGCWLRLGSPTKDRPLGSNLTLEGLKELVALEIASTFQTVLLEAAERGGGGAESAS